MPFLLISALCSGFLQTSLCCASAALFGCTRLAAVNRHFPPHCFCSLSAYQQAEGDIPTPFLYPCCLQRTLAERTLCATSCAKTKPVEGRRGDGWGLRPSVFTLLCSCSVQLLFCFLFEWCEDLYSHVLTLGTSLFLISQIHFLVLRINRCKMLFFFYLLKCTKV